MFARGDGMMDCYPMPCTCCECRGVHCFVWHPSHSHKTDQRLAFQAGILRATLPESPEAIAATMAEVLAKYPKTGGGDTNGE